MALRLLEQPTLYPVNVSDMIAHLRLDFPADSNISDAEQAQADLLDTYIEAATQYVRNSCNCEPGVNVKYQFTLSHFPDDRFLILPMPPLQSVESVTYVNSAGQEQTLSPDLYRIHSTTKPGCVHLKTAAPSDSICEPEAVKVNFTAGYPDIQSVPQTLRVAIMCIAGHLWENREATAAIKLEANPYVQALLNNHTFYRFGMEV